MADANKQDYTKNPFQTPSTDTGDKAFDGDLSPYKTLIDQVKEEYNIAWRAQNGRISQILKRLRLYNNQRRDTDAVGDTTLFDIFQSIFAALYSDQLTTEFMGRTEGSADTAEALNNTAKFDYDEMHKDIIDYEWDWDTLFYANGYVSMTYFDRKKMISVPEVWDPLTMLHDPDAVAINGYLNSNKGAARYFGREIQNRKVDMEDIPSVFDLDYLNSTRPTKSLIEQARQEREAAQGLNNQVRLEEKNLGVNVRYPLLEWYTWWQDEKLTQGKPKRVMVWIGNDLKKVVRFKVIKKDFWPVVHRKLFPTSHVWDGVSIPDLVEDKQRMKAVMMNMAVKDMKSNLFAMRLYNSNRIKNKSDMNYDFDKIVPVDLKPGESINDQVAAMPKSDFNLQMFNWIMTALDHSAQRATSTPEMQMGQPTKGNKTLGELNKVDTKSATRYSLAAKIWNWSEREFWDHWYLNYKDHFKSRIDEKMVRINTAFGTTPKFKYYSRTDIISDIDPDVFITSKFITDQQRTNDRALAIQFGQVLATVQGANMRYFVKDLARLHNFTKDKIDMILEPTPDEMKARFENIDLENDKTVPVNPNDKHMEHLPEHAKAKETAAMLAHIATHLHAMELQQQQPDLFPQMQQQQQQAQQQQQGQQPVGDQLGKTGKKKFNQPQVTHGGMGMMQQ